MASTTDLAPDLADHGDRQVPAGCTDLAVNVLPDTPAWLRAELADLDLAAYPRTSHARAAVAARHGLDPAGCMLTNGAAEAFWAVAHGLRPRLAACVHPSFTAPEAALRAAGVPVHRVVRRPEDGFALDPAEVPDECDLVVLGRPDNPTGREEPRRVVEALLRPGRVVVLDEAFADFWPDGSTLASHGHPGLLCVRSLTKLWGLAGLRVGYVLGDPALFDRLARALPPWPVNTLAAHAALRLSGAEDERRQRAARVAEDRARLVAALDGSPWRVWESRANFVLLGGARTTVREELLGRGLAVRRCGSFPGLDATYVRVAVPAEPTVREHLVGSLGDLARRGPAA